MATIATHNRSFAHRDHNIRGKSTENQSHIRQDGVHEIWHDEKPREAYHRIFDAALEEYNNKQKRADRKINDYFNHIMEDKNKKPVYEMIVGVYGGYPEDVCKAILKDFYEGWKERNPQLELIGAYYHADEEGEPHLHIDYIPVADGYKRGMSLQNGLSKALEKQGFVTENSKRTAQIQWEQRENNALEEICNDYGIEVEHPQKGKGVNHITTKAFKAQKDLEKVEGDIKYAHEQENALKEQIQSHNDMIRQQEHQILENEIELDKLKGALVEQEHLKERTVDKNVLGKSKDTVTLPYEEYQSLHHHATIQDDVKNLQRALKVEKAAVNKKVEELADKEQEINQMLLEANDRLQKAPIHKDHAIRYKRIAERSQAENESLKSELAELKGNYEQIADRNVELYEDIKDLKAEVKEQKKELSFFRRLVGSIKEWVMDKLNKLFDLEEIIREPEGELSKNNWRNRKFKEGPYAEWSGLNNRYQYYWLNQNNEWNNSDLKGCLRLGYYPLAKEISQEDSRLVKFLDKDLINQANEAHKEFMQRNRGKSL